MEQHQEFDQAGVVKTELPTSQNEADSGRSPQPFEITLYKIEEILLDYIKNVIKPSVMNNGALTPVPVLMGNPERWVSVRKEGFLRDPKTQQVQLPLIMMRRSNITRNPLTSPVNKFLDKTFETGWNAHNAYDRFNAINNMIPSRDVVKVTIPDYIDLTYEVLVWTAFETQINSLIEQINFEVDEFWGRRNGFKFRVYVTDYNQQNDLPATEERMIRATFSMVVKGYLLPLKGQINDAGPVRTTKHETTPKLKLIFTKIDGGKLSKS